MALLKPKEFYELCGITKSHFYVYKKRDKFILTNGMIDDTIEPNASFIKTCVERKDGRSEVEGSAEKPAQNPDGKVSGTTPDEFKPKDPTKYSLELEVKRLSITKAEEEIQLAILKREKLAGEVIPTDLVRIMFASHFKNVTTYFHQAVENLITQIAKKNDLSREQVAKIRGKLTGVINKGIENALSASKKELKGIVEDYSNKKGRGEKA